jgi:hypothetical protein
MVALPMFCVLVQGFLMVGLMLTMYVVCVCGPTVARFHRAV